jgi:hypothetical protein
VARRVAELSDALIALEIQIVARECSRPSKSLPGRSPNGMACNWLLVSLRVWRTEDIRDELTIGSCTMKLI